MPFCVLVMCPYIYATLWQTEAEVAAGCFTGACSAVIRPDLKLTRAHPRPSFPLQPLKMKSFHNIYPGNNDVWFDSLLGVSLWGLFLPSAATERENRQKLCPQGEKRKSHRSLFMDDARSVYFCAFRMKSCCVGCVTHAVFLAYFISLSCFWQTLLECSLGSSLSTICVFLFSVLSLCCCFPGFVCFFLFASN